MSAFLAGLGTVAGGTGGFNPVSPSSASGGTSSSGRNVISIGPTGPNLEAIINAVQGGGNSGVNGSVVRQPTFLPNNINKAGVDFRLPGIDAGITINPLLILGGLAIVLVGSRLIKR